MAPNPYESPKTIPAMTPRRFRFPLTVTELFVIVAVVGILASLFLSAQQSAPRPRHREPSPAKESSAEDLDQLKTGSARRVPCCDLVEAQGGLHSSSVFELMDS